MFVEVVTRNLKEGSMLASCWHDEFTIGFLEVQRL